MSEENQVDAAAAAPEANKMQFALQRMYIKDVSFESPQGYKAFQGEWKPEVNLDLNMGRDAVDDNNWEVTLSLTITVKNAEETAFLIEIHQAGIFLCGGMEEEQRRYVLNTTCAEILFPYAREAVDNLVTKGGFPALMLSPINFQALYQQAMAQRADQEAKAGTAEGGADATH
ncbi:MAG: protein-export chaperone SecB [Pseudomonadales bacterium]